MIWPKKGNILKHKKLLSHIKMSEEVVTFSDIEIEKNIYYYPKNPISWKKDVDIEKVLVFIKISSVEKNCK